MGSNADRGCPEVVIWVSIYIDCDLISPSLFRYCSPPKPLYAPANFVGRVLTYHILYRDVLELKAIQRSLPTAPQLPDPLARRPHSHILQGVPIGLLPLYDDSLPCNSVSKPAQNPGPSPYELPPVPSRSPSFPPTSGYTSHSTTSIASSPPHSSRRTSANSYAPRPKPNFTFLPLLETSTPPPPPSEVDTDDSDHDLSTPTLSSASLDTTPSPREHSDSDSLSYFQLSSRKPAASPNSYSPPCPPAHKPAFATSRTPPPFSLYPPNTAEHYKSANPKKQARPMSPVRLDINGETFHFGPMSTPPDSPSPPRSPISPRYQLPSPSSPPKSFAYDQERRQDLQPSLSRTTARNQGAAKSSIRSKDFHPPSPVLAPHCVSMKRGSGSPCSSPVRGSTMGGKGRFEH